MLSLLEKYGLANISEPIKRKLPKVTKVKGNKTDKPCHKFLLIKKINMYLKTILRIPAKTSN